MRVVMGVIAYTTSILACGQTEQQLHDTPTGGTIGSSATGGRSTGRGAGEGSAGESSATGGTQIRAGVGGGAGVETSGGAAGGGPIVDWGAGGQHVEPLHGGSSNGSGGTLSPLGGAAGEPVGGTVPAPSASGSAGVQGEVESATYSGELVIGAYDRIRLRKADGASCANMVLWAPALTGGLSTALELPDGWGVERGSLGSCSDGSPSTPATGASGTISWRADGSQCVLALHFTAIFAEPGDTTSELQRVRFEADGVALSSGYPCE